MAFGFMFSKKGDSAEKTELRAPYKLTLAEKVFVDFKTENLFARILKRCYHKTLNLDDKDGNIASSVFFNTENNGKKNGTIPLIARAISRRTKIYLVYDSTVGLTREANTEEQKEIIKKYDSQNNKVSKLDRGKYGIALDFTDYELTLLVRCYMSLIYSVMSSANTQVKLSESIQIKIDKLRENISNLTSEDATKQANEVNDALKAGNSVLLSSLDQVIQTAINSDSIDKALDLFNTQLASDLGLSFSFVSGKLTSGMSATGDADINYEDQGIKDFWVSIWKPVCVKLYDRPKVKYKSDRWRAMEAKIKMLPFIETSSLISEKTKQEYADEIFDINEDQ